MHIEPTHPAAGATHQMAPRGSDATAWIEKFMKAAFHEMDPELMGYKNEMTPLAVVAAARWRKTLDDVQREEALRRQAAALAEDARLQEDKARSEGEPWSRNSRFPCCLSLLCATSSYGGRQMRMLYTV